MRIVMINGSMRKETTYNIGKILINNVTHDSNDNIVKEFFLPRDMNKFCMGCFNCMNKGEDKCPHNTEMIAITDEMDKADLLVFTSPVYVLHTSGQMKAFLDHCAYMFMVHRPRESMFKKQAVVISTAAGSGTKSTNKDIRDSLLFWGVGKVYCYGKNVRSTSWSEVNNEIKEEIRLKVSKIANNINRNNGRIHSSLKVKLLFYIIRGMHKKGMFYKRDTEYWKKKGWLEGERPWK